MQVALSDFEGNPLFVEYQEGSGDTNCLFSGEMHLNNRGKSDTTDCMNNSNFSQYKIRPMIVLNMLKEEGILY